MRVTTVIVFTLITLTLTGCSHNKDPRVNLGPGVGSSDVGNNVITRPVTDTVNIILGKGIVITGFKTTRSDSGFMIAQVSGINEGVSKRLLEYKVEWMDEDGFVLDTITDNWMPVSVGPTSRFTFKMAATSRKAADYRFDTRIDHKAK
jgi:uncharacterized protein YcfL